MDELLAQLVRRLRPVEGWPPFLLLLLAMLCPVAALSTSSDQYSAAEQVLLTVVGLVTGLRLARSHLSGRAVALLAGLMGLGLSTVYAGRLFPPPTLLWEELAYATGWVQNWRQGIPGWPLPFVGTAQFVWQQLNALGFRLSWWLQTVTGGREAQDQIAVFLLVAFLAWSSTVFATWQIYRRRAALLGLAPGAVSMVLLAFFHGGITNIYLMFYGFCAAWLVAICHLWRSTARWQEKGTDYPGGLGVELLLAYGPFLMMVLLVAALFPVIYPSQIRDRFWEIMDAPWSRVEQAAEQVLGPIEGVSSGDARSSGGAKGELPRRHLLGGRPELGETIVLYASTSDPPPPIASPDPGESEEPAGPRRYWRADTWDTYTGLGWVNDPLESETLPPNQSLATDQTPGLSLVQQFQRVVPGDDRVYAVNAPLRFDQSVQAWWRTGQDLAYLTSDTSLYTVISAAPEPSSTELRALSPLTATLPSELGQRYLALPASVPQRVLNLAQEVVRDAPTYYDRARAIERYLRTYPYNLDVPEPPTDRDLVDYFLFELQEGYCDYYASAMVVMARSVGVPSRLASGYVQGTYDDENRRWVVTEEEAHSWVEVYFEGVGWIEFEPTAGRPALTRPDTPNQPAISVPPLPPRQVRWWQEIPWALIVQGALLAALLVGIAWQCRPRPALAAADLVRDRHERLVRWGQRLGHPLGRGQTIREYGQTLGRALRTRGRGTRLSQAQQASAEVAAEIETLVQVFEQAQYSAQSISERQAGQVRAAWARLQRHLWWLRLAPGGTTEEKRDSQTGDDHAS